MYSNCSVGNAALASRGGQAAFREAMEGIAPPAVVREDEPDPRRESRNFTVPCIFGPAARRAGPVRVPQARAPAPRRCPRGFPRNEDSFGMAA